MLDQLLEFLLVLPVDIFLLGAETRRREGVNIILFGLERYGFRMVPLEIPE